MATAFGKKHLQKTNASPDWAPKFLDVFAKSGNITAAAKKADVSRQAIYERIENDAAFKAQFDYAREEATEYLEGIAWKRATRQKQPSDTLLIFLLKGNAPTKYRERIQHSNDPKEPFVSQQAIVQLDIPEGAVLRPLRKKKDAS